jgi:hypothetical protein
MEKIDVAQIAKEIKERAQSSSNEEEVKIGFAIVLDPILKSWNIKPAYERHASGVRCIVSGLQVHERDRALSTTLRLHASEERHCVVGWSFDEDEGD